MRWWKQVYLIVISSFNSQNHHVRARLSWSQSGLNIIHWVVLIYAQIKFYSLQLLILIQETFLFFGCWMWSFVENLKFSCNVFCNFIRGKFLFKQKSLFEVTETFRQKFTNFVSRMRLSCNSWNLINIFACQISIKERFENHWYDRKQTENFKLQALFSLQKKLWTEKNYQIQKED